jgi:hypothetical protein
VATLCVAVLEANLVCGSKAKYISNKLFHELELP